MDMSIGGLGAIFNSCSPMAKAQSPDSLYKEVIEKPEADPAENQAVTGPTGSSLSPSTLSALNQIVEEIKTEESANDKFRQALEDQRKGPRQASKNEAEEKPKPIQEHQTLAEEAAELAGEGTQQVNETSLSNQISNPRSGR